MAPLEGGSGDRRSSGMVAPPPPLHLFLLLFSGRVIREQVKVIEYQKEKRRLLRERLGGRPAPARLNRDADSVGLRTRLALTTLRATRYLTNVTEVRRTAEGASP
jgi:hypothetical protein